MFTYLRAGGSKERTKEFLCRTLVAVKTALQLLQVIIVYIGVIRPTCQLENGERENEKRLTRTR